MITREQIYGKEATEILRYVTTYHCITRNHLLRIYPDREKQIDNLLKYLLRQGRIFTSPNTADVFFDNSECPLDREMLAALWVYADFSDRAEYHYAGEFPVKIVHILTCHTDVLNTEERTRCIRVFTQGIRADRCDRCCDSTDTVQHTADLCVEVVVGVLLRVGRGRNIPLSTRAEQGKQNGGK